VRRFRWSRTCTTELWLSELLAHSDHAALAASVRARLRGGVADAINRFGGSFTRSFTTVLFAAERR